LVPGFLFWRTKFKWLISSVKLEDDFDLAISGGRTGYWRGLIEEREALGFAVLLPECNNAKLPGWNYSEVKSTLFIQ